MSIDIKSILKYAEDFLRAELKKIHPGIDVTIKYPFIIIYAPTDAIIEIIKKEIKVEETPQYTLFKISWDIDGIRYYLKIKDEGTEVVT